MVRPLARDGDGRRQAGDCIYMRSPEYDSLLSMLFPEMATRLAKPFGRRPDVPVQVWHRGKSRFRPTAHAAEEASSPLGGEVLREPLPPGAGGDIRHLIFRGAELEAWKRANPDVAADWGVNRAEIPGVDVLGLRVG